MIRYTAKKVTLCNYNYAPFTLNCSYITVHTTQRTLHTTSVIRNTTMRITQYYNNNNVTLHYVREIRFDYPDDKFVLCKYNVKL